MLALIVSDSPAFAAPLRNALIQRGHECPHSSVVSLDAAADALRAMRPEPQLILIALGADVERSEAALRTIRTQQRARIIAIGPRDSNRILNALHSGATDYVDEGSDLLDGLNAALERGAAQGSQTSSLARIISVTAGSGGCGRTTVATNLAALLAAKHGRCALLDLHLSGGNAAAFLNLKPAHTVVDLCRNLGKLDRQMFEQSLLVHETGIHLLPAPRSPDEAPDVTLDGVTRILRLAQALFPFVVVDLDDIGHPALRHVLRESTSVLLLSRLDFAAIGNAHTALERLELARVGRDRIRFVMNRVGQPGELPASRVSQVLGLPQIDQLPEDGKSVNVALNCGKACIVESPRSKFVTALGTLALRLDQPETPADSEHTSTPDGSSRPPTRSPHRFFSRLSMALG